MNIKSKKSEYDHFSSLASQWWSKKGAFKTLHDIQPLRIQYIKEILNRKNLNGLKILDLGCGGGLVSEGIAKLGANVTAIDFIEDNIKIAKQHAIENNLKINYLLKDFEKYKIDSKFDVVVIFEVLEHLNDWESFLSKILLNLKKNSIIIISTINRNLISKFLSIDIAENYVKWIPKNTHNYYKFIKPDELKSFFIKNNFNNIKFRGLTFNPFRFKWGLTDNLKINYFCSCVLN